MIAKYRGMSDRERWVRYHQICNEWIDQNQPFNEVEFHKFVRGLTKDMGL